MMMMMVGGVQKNRAVLAEVGNEGGRRNEEQGDVVKCVDVFQSHKCSNFS